METLEEVSFILLNNSEFTLLSNNPITNDKLLKVFETFDTSDKNVLYHKILNIIDTLDNEKIDLAFNTIKYHKGLFEFFDENVTFELYQRIEQWIDPKYKIKFKISFYKDYASKLLNNKTEKLDDDIINLIFVKDVNLYIKVAKKLNIVDAGTKIFNRYPLSIYDWLNVSDDVYSELMKINQPQFILKNMSGNLHASDDALKYIIEFSEPNTNLLVAIKRKMGFKKFFHLVKNRVNGEIFVDLIESLDDLIFVINIVELDLKTLELILNKTKEKFPFVYDNLNSLMFVKKKFINK